MYLVDDVKLGLSFKEIKYPVGKEKKSIPMLFIYIHELVPAFSKFLRGACLSLGDGYCYLMGIAICDSDRQR